MKDLRVVLPNAKVVMLPAWYEFKTDTEIADAKAIILEEYEVTEENKCWAEIYR